MSVNEQMVQDVVKEVMAKLQLSSEPSAKLGVFHDMNDAIAAAKKAQVYVHRMSMDQREHIISNIRKKTHENAEILARMGVEETGMGNVPHKILKHQLVAEKTPGTEDITTTAWSGDKGLTLIERGPFGVIGAITPCTNPSETIICNTIGMLAGGNTVVFNPHPAAIRTSLYAINMLNEACVEAGGPENIACTVFKPTLETSNIMMKHKDIQLIAATGGPGVVTAVLSSGRRGIGAGAGNPPALVDETADVRKAAEDIVNGCTFDNNLPCIAEKEIVAVDLDDKILEKLDYAIISMHLPNKKPDTIEKNTFAYINAMNHPKVKIVGHCDDVKYPVDYEALIVAAIHYHVVLEVNNSSLSPDGYRGDTRENIRTILRLSQKYNHPIVLSSDSHGTEHIGDFQYALELIRELAFPETLILNTSSKNFKDFLGYV